jgi:hypothetical protein
MLPEMTILIHFGGVIGVETSQVKIPGLKPIGMADYEVDVGERSYVIQRSCFHCCLAYASGKGSKIGC